MTTKKVVSAAMLASLCCIATMIIKIPSLLKGYINLGDCVVLLSGFTLSPLYAFFAAGIGSALADIFSGYAVYAPATFVIKGVMALICFYGFKFLGEKTSTLTARVVSGALAELIMVGGYFVFEGFMYGFIPSAVNIAPNAVQGAAGLVLGVILARIFEKHKIIH
ncbi:MAG: ECF transporter S component [Ruminococcaceae bacterium]|nr:ECF transporter S component [Oscillospiraceae bacterium]